MRKLLSVALFALLLTLASTPASALTWHPRVRGAVTCLDTLSPPAYRIAWKIRNAVGVRVPMRVLSHSRPLRESIAGTTIANLTQTVKAQWRWKTVSSDGTVGHHRKTGTGKGYVLLLGDCTAPAPTSATFHVLGSGTADVTWGNMSGSSQATVSLPWTATVPLDPSFDAASLVAQDDTGSVFAQVTCQIVEDGVLVAQTTASGAYAVCSASH